ncbi:unnamed protein product [Scytosiphon promiscuus]
MRNLFGQGGPTGKRELRERPLRCLQDPDTPDAMGAFASPKRMGHYGPISDVCTLSYEPTNGLLAVASREGMVKVFGGPGVELVLEEEGSSVAGEDPPAHLLFSTPTLLVGVTATGAVLSWDLVAGGRGDTIPSPLDPTTGLEERVTSVHAHDGSGLAGADSDAPEERYVFVGFESGRVRVSQVFPTCRASGYGVEPRDTSHGVPEELLAPGGEHSGRSLGAVTCITSCGERDGGGGGGGSLGVFGHRHGGIVVWDWVRRKRIAVRSVRSAAHPRGAEAGEEADRPPRRQGTEGGEEDREVTGLAFHPSGEAFAAGFASGCYAVFSASSPFQEASPPRWVREVGDDGSCPREGPTIVRTAVSSVRWVSVRGGAAADRPWGLAVAGGVEMEEGEEPDGVSLLVPSSVAPAGGASGSGGGGRVRKRDIVAAAKATLETAVFVPFAIGQERLSHVHCVVSRTEAGRGAAPDGSGSGSSTHDGAVPLPGEVPEGKEAAQGGEGEAAPAEQDGGGDQASASEELIVLGLVRWNEEVRGDDGRLHFRYASRVQACPIQTSPYVALLQLAPEKFGPNFSGFAAVTAVATSPLLPSPTIRDFMACLGTAKEQAAEGTKGGSPASRLLRGGHLRWPDSVPLSKRNEALCASELLVAGHSDGSLSLWECYGPASRQDGICITDGRVVMREVPSGAVLLGVLPVAELAGGEGVGADTSVTALDVWVERDHVAAAERNACWVGVGFHSGDAAVIVLSDTMEVASTGGVFGGGGGGKAESGGGTPLAEKPVEISDVQLGGGALGDTSADGSSGGAGSILKRFAKHGVGVRQQTSRGGEDKGATEDDDLDVAIAEARAEARAIAAHEDSGKKDPEVATTAVAHDVAEDRADEQSAGKKAGDGGKQEGAKEGAEAREGVNLRQELSEAMAEGGTWGDSGAAPVSARAQPPAAEAPEEENAQEGEQRPLELDAPRKASPVQLALRLHSHPVHCIALSFDTRASSLALVVADTEGVVSVTDVSTGSASLLPMRVPQSRPCCPCLAIGPLPSALSGGRAQGLGASGVLFVLLEDWLNVFDLESRDPIDFAQVPGLGTGESSWLSCVDQRGLPLVPYASEPFDSSFSPHPAGVNQGVHGGFSSGGVGGGGFVGSGSFIGGGSGGEAPPRSQTIWVSPSPSRTALEERREHELQLLSDPPTPTPLLLAVRGTVAAVLEISLKEVETVSSVFSLRSSPPAHSTGTFKGMSSAELVVRSRETLPRAEGHAEPPTVEGAGLCMVPAGMGPKADGSGRRGCLLAADSSGFMTALLLPSLCPVFRDRLPTTGAGAGPRGGAAALARQSLCNIVGHVVLRGTAGELTRWTALTDEACEALMGPVPRLAKVSTLARQPGPSRQSSGGSGGGGGGGALSSSSKGKPARGMLGRLSLGGSKKSVVDVFAVEPSPRRQSLTRNPSGGSSGFGSTRSSLSYGAGGGSGPIAAAGRDAGDGWQGAAAARAHGQREALFGQRVAASGGGGRGTAEPGGVRGGVGGTHAAVSEARDLAIERGEKLENMVDRSRQLEDSAMAFGDMAKQLRRQQEDESCCVS